MEPFSVPAHALFQPSRTKLEALVKKDYLGKSKVTFLASNWNNFILSNVKEFLMHLLLHGWRSCKISAFRSHKVPSSILALPRFEYCETFFFAKANSAFHPSEVGK